MAEVLPGAPAPVASEVTPPAADAVPALDAPVVENAAEPPKADEPVQAPRTYSEEETRKLVSERLTKERRRLERAVRAELERDFYKQQLEAAKPPPQPQGQSEGEPKSTDFADYESYSRALIRWETKQALKQHREESERETSQQRDHRDMAEYAQKVQEKTRKAAEKYDDFHEVIHGGVYTKPMTAFIAEVAKDPGELAYFLGNNMEEAERIAGLSPAKQVVEMHLLESRLGAPPKPTNAPPPIVPNASNAKVETGYRPDMTDKEYADMRRRQKAARKS